MAFKFTNIIPVWKNKGLAPEEEIQNTGFRGGYKPPAHIFNWFWHLVSSAIGELQSKVEEVNDDYLSKSQGGTVEGKVTFSKDTTFESNAEIKKKLTVDKESEFKGTVTAKGLKCGEATFSGTLRAEKGLKAAQIEATDDKNSRVGKEKEPYKDIYGVDLHAENMEVSGTITNTDLKNKLDGKANKTHTHQSADITDLQEKLNGKANTSHKHLSSDITDLQAALDGKAAKEHTHTSSQVTDLDATIQAAISKADHLKRQIVTSLPDAGDEHIIYMMKKTGGTGNDVYDEYMWIDNKFELIGNSKVDLTGYAKSTDLESYLKKTEEAASAKKVAHKLSITQNGGTAATYDGSADTSIAITAASVGAAAANHKHVTSDVTDLQSKLDGKANTGHTHTSAQITDLQKKLDGYLPLTGGTVNGNVDIVGEVGVRNISDLSPCDYRFINWTFTGGVAHFVLRKDMHNSDDDVTLMETLSDTDNVYWNTPHMFHKGVTIEGSVNTDRDKTGYIGLRSTDEVRIQAKNTFIIEDSNNNDAIEFSTSDKQPFWNFGDTIVIGKYVKHRTHIVIASYNTKNPLKGNADFTCTEDDATTPFLKALESIEEGGKIELLDGAYNFKYGVSAQTTGIVINKKNITIEGSGFSTAVIQPRDSGSGESSPIFIITASDVKIKNMMVCSVTNSETAITSTTPMIQQQAEGAIYDGVFFIHDRVLPECYDSCIYGTLNCSYTRIQNCRVFSVGNLGTDKAVFDFGTCTSFSGIISGIISSGNNETVIKLKDKASEDSVQLFGNQRQKIIYQHND